MGPEVPGERLTSLHDLSATDELSSLSSTEGTRQWPLACADAMNSVMPYNTTSFSSAGDVHYKFEVFGVSAIHPWEALALLRMHTQARASSRTSISKPEDLTSKLCQENSTPSIANLPIFDNTLKDLQSSQNSSLQSTSN